MNEIIYQEADLNYIFIRAKLPNGSWGNLSLNELSDEQFVDWATKRFGVEIKDDMNAKGTAWTSQQKIHFLNDMTDRLGKPAATMIKRKARNNSSREGDNN